MDSKNVFAVIMAGGRGERFWPMSRISKPKQLLNLVGELTLIEQTVNRLNGLVPVENIIIITNDDYVEPMTSIVTSLPAENIVGEPVGRDTAPCVALATALVQAKLPEGDDGVMFLLPADHVINDADAMVSVLRDCVDQAAAGNVVTIGVNPTFPSTGYGYIQCGAKLDASCSTPFFVSKGFKEKPDLATAEQFLESGEYKWNSGMFGWSVSTISNAFEQYNSGLSTAIKTFKDAAQSGSIKECLAEVYPGLEKISIDYAVMEKIDNVVVAECGFDWDDVGSWPALRNQIEADANGHVVKANHVSVDSTNCIVVGESDHLITTIGVDDLIIVQTPDATLVCKTGSAQQIKDAVKLIAENVDLSKYL